MDCYLVVSGWQVSSAGGGESGGGWGLDRLWSNGLLPLLFPFSSSSSAPSQSTIKKGTKEYIPQAMSSLSQRILLEPWDWRVLGRWGELALMNGYVRGFDDSVSTFLRKRN